MQLPVITWSTLDGLRIVEIDRVVNKRCGTDWLHRQPLERADATNRTHGWRGEPVAVGWFLPAAAELRGDQLATDSTRTAGAAEILGAGTNGWDCVFTHGLEREDYVFYGLNSFRVGDASGLKIVKNLAAARRSSP